MVTSESDPNELVFEPIENDDMFVMLIIVDQLQYRFNASDTPDSFGIPLEWTFGPVLMFQGPSDSDAEAVG